MNRRWSEREIETIRALYASTPRRETAARLGRTERAVATMAKRLGLRKTNYRPWTKSEIADLRRLYADTPSKGLAAKLGRPLRMVYQKAAKLGLKKSDAYLASAAACRLRPGDNVGAAFRFKPGHIPANKGTRRPGYAPGRMAETQFKKGQRPHTWRPVGTILKDADGYLRMKVRDDPQRIAGVGSSSTNWMYVHRMVWEQANGPIPPGHKICFKDGDKTNCSLGNLFLMSNGQRMQANSIHRLPDELRRVIQLQGVLKRQIRRLERGKESLRGPAESSLRNAGAAQG